MTMAELLESGLNTNISEENVANKNQEVARDSTIFEIRASSTTNNEKMLKKLTNF